jgi:predicted small lipoprotein YifL
MNLRCAAIFVCFLISACGQKGDLYHPEDKPNTKIEQPSQHNPLIGHESSRLYSDRPLQQNARPGQ